MRMAFLQASPMSTTRPTCTKMLLSPPVSQTPNSAENMHIGTMRITASGSVQLSYSEASTRKTSTTASRKTIGAALLWLTCW